MSALSCSCCDAAREAPAHRMYSLACLYCGARLIRAIGRISEAWNRTEEIVRRRRAVLADWVAYGHDEAELRRLAKTTAPLAPPPEKPAPKGRAAR